jgi:hypothetical protein
MILTELDKVAVWRPVVNSKLDVKHMTDYPYLENGKRSSGDVFRYVKNYDLDDKLFSLIVVSKIDDPEAVEAYLDNLAPTTPLDLCDGSLHKTDKKMELEPGV